MARDRFEDEEFSSAAFYGGLNLDEDETPAEVARREDQEWEARQIAAEDLESDEDEVSWYREMEDYRDVD